LLEIIPTNRFLKDIALAKKRGKSMKKIQAVIETLAKEEVLAEKHKPHRLSGNWNSFSECHIEPDWLLIYRVSNGYIYLTRTGSHSDLF